MLPKLKHLGYLHIERGIESEDYDVMEKAILHSIINTLGENFTFEEKQAWSMVFKKLKESIISDNYEERSNYKEVYEKSKLTAREINFVIVLWKKYILKNFHHFGETYFKKLFEVYPEMMEKFY